MEVQSRQPDCDSRPDLKQSLLWHLFKSVVLVVFSLWVRRCVWGGVRCVCGAVGQVSFQVLTNLLWFWVFHWLVVHQLG